MGKVKTYFDHPCRGVQVRIRIRLKAITKSTFGVSLEVTPKLISTRKTEIFWGSQIDILYPLRGDVPKIHQVYYLSDLIRIIILI